MSSVLAAGLPFLASAWSWCGFEGVVQSSLCPSGDLVCQGRACSCPAWALPRLAVETHAPIFSPWSTHFLLSSHSLSGDSDCAQEVCGQRPEETVQRLPGFVLSLSAPFPLQPPDFSPTQENPWALIEFPFPLLGPGNHLHGEGVLLGFPCFLMAS